MAYSSQRPVTIQGRLRLLERELKPQMSWMEEEALASWSSWLAGAVEAPALIEELEAYLGPSLSIRAALAHPLAREALLEASRSMLTFKPSREEQTPWDLG